MLHFPFYRVIPFYCESRASKTKSPPNELRFPFSLFSRSSQHSFSRKRAHRMNGASGKQKRAFSFVFSNGAFGKRKHPVSLLLFSKETSAKRKRAFSFVFSNGASTVGSRKTHFRLFSAEHLRSGKCFFVRSIWEEHFGMNGRTVERFGNKHSRFFKT